MKLKVLLVDDNEMIRIYFKDIFWVHGLDQKIDLTTAENMEQAVRILNDDQKRPELIFLDLSLPENGQNKADPTNGFKLLEKIKADKKLQNIKVIIFSGFSDLKYKEQAKNLGAAEYLVKDENLPQDLVDYLRKLL